MHLPKPLILASRSPRRIALLRQIGFDPEVCPCEIPEVFDPSRSPAENAKDLAFQKARCIGRNVGEGIVLGADTIVVIDGEILGKPADGEEAVRMLQRLSGKTHIVFTAFSLLDRPS